MAAAFMLWDATSPTIGYNGSLHGLDGARANATSGYPRVSPELGRQRRRIKGIV